MAASDNSDAYGARAKAQQRKALAQVIVERTADGMPVIQPDMRRPPARNACGGVEFRMVDRRCAVLDNKRIET